MSTFLFPSHRRPAVLALTLCQMRFDELRDDREGADHE